MHAGFAHPFAKRTVLVARGFDSLPLLRWPPNDATHALGIGIHALRAGTIWNTGGGPVSILADSPSGKARSCNLRTPRFDSAIGLTWVAKRQRGWLLTSSSQVRPLPHVQCVRAWSESGLLSSSCRVRFLTDARARPGRWIGTAPPKRGSRVRLPTGARARGWYRGCASVLQTEERGSSPLPRTTICSRKHLVRLAGCLPVEAGSIPVDCAMSTGSPNRKRQRHERPPSAGSTPAPYTAPG